MLTNLEEEEACMLAYRQASNINTNFLINLFQEIIKTNYDCSNLNNS